MAVIISDRQDLTYLQWAHIRSSSGTAGSFLKSQATIGGIKQYYKLSGFDPSRGVVGGECINEIIVDRLLTILGVEHLSYTLINADIEVDGSVYNTYLCASEDFKQRGESKIALDDYYRENALPGESHYDFCVRQGWKDYVEKMIVIDYLILNRDRHGANIEILRNARAHTLRPAPYFDHGISLLCSCNGDDDARSFDVMKDLRCNNFIGSFSCRDNLDLISTGNKYFEGMLTPSHKSVLFDGLEKVLSKIFIDKIWELIYERYKVYEKL